MLYTKLYFVPLAITTTEPGKESSTSYLRVIIRCTEPLTTPQQIPKLEKYLEQRLKANGQTIKVLVMGWPYLLAPTVITEGAVPSTFILPNCKTISDCIVPKWGAIT